MLLCARERADRGSLPEGGLFQRSKNLGLERSVHGDLKWRGAYSKRASASESLLRVIDCLRITALKSLLFIYLNLHVQRTHSIVDKSNSDFSALVRWLQRSALCCLQHCWMPLTTNCMQRPNC